MTYAVLYTTQFEPITVLDIRPWMWDMLWGGARILIPVPEPMPSVPWSDEPTVEQACRRHTVEMWGEPIQRRGQRTLLLFTDQDELALLLRADFLPGQRSEIQADQRVQFARGFFDALNRMMPR